jgi:hypothetical protein
MAALAWIICALLSYRRVRSYYARRNAKWIAIFGTDDSAWRWTVSKRNRWLVISVIFGPILLWTVWMVYSDDDGKKPERLATW